ncbi:hypothetical protein PG990_004311 [Apiospora arundinis]
MATRHVARTNYVRHLARLYHDEYRGGFQSSISMAVSRQQQQQQQRGFSSSRSFASPLFGNNHGQGDPSSISGAAPPVDIEAIRAEMLARPEQFTYDTLTPTPSYLLDITLADYLRASNKYNKYSDSAELPKYPLPAIPPPPRLPPHPLPPRPPPSGLCPDGTDPYHSPGRAGGPFSRRMWAGGSIEFNHHAEPLQLQPYGTLAVCAERIQDVALRGLPGREKLFVDVLRRYDRARPPQTPQKNATAGRPELATAGGLLQADKFAVREVRTLVFMRDTNTNNSSSSSSSSSSDDTATATEERLIKYAKKPTYTQTLTPDRTLLFHFSALSYNAHLIHLDERYSQTVEGHPGLLVHGPLCLNLMLEVLRRSRRNTKDEELIISRIDYRNLAPLYVGDEMTVCVRSPPKKGQKHDVWIENQRGGLCVKGTVITK